MKEKRIIACLIDSFIGLAIGMFSMLPFAPLIIGLESDVFNLIFSRVMLNIPVLLKDFWSIGHKKYGFIVIDKDGLSATPLKKIVRNIPLVLGLGLIELILIFLGRERIGDKLAKTKVVYKDLYIW